jgi:hypothetical protein
MPPKKKTSTQKAKAPGPAKKDPPSLLPKIPEVPGKPLDLEVYNVAGLLWEGGSDAVNVLRLTDLLPGAARGGKPETVDKLMKFLLSDPDVQDSDSDGTWSCIRYW